MLQATEIYKLLNSAHICMVIILTRICRTESKIDNDGFVYGMKVLIPVSSN
jgi:hypothetical protein